MASISSAGSSRPRPRAAAGSRTTMVRDLLAQPLADYYLVLVSTALLVALGALMVLSASSVYAEAIYDDPYFFAKKQMLFLVVGVPAAYGLSRLAPRLLKVLGWAALALAIVLLLAVFTPLGYDAGKGNRAWLNLGVTVQPAEFAKLALVLWAATFVQAKEAVIDRVKDLVPLVLGFGLVMALVLAEKDLGTTLVIGAIFFGVLWIIGVPGRMIGLLGTLGVLGVLVMVATSPNRMVRIAAFLGLAKDDPTASQQPVAAIYALASGGWWGQGLGGSRQKWGNLYDGAQNDFVFAVLGEELGLVGTLIVLALFFLLGFAALRIALRSDSTFTRVLSGSIAVWLMFQAMANIGVACGMLPVLGVPLPFLSYGGSALLSNLLAVGLLLSCAKQEPAARRLLSRRRGEPAPRVTTVVDGGR